MCLDSGQIWRVPRFHVERPAYKITLTATARRCSTNIGWHNGLFTVWPTLTSLLEKMSEDDRSSRAGHVFVHCHTMLVRYSHPMTLHTHPGM